MTSCGSSPHAGLIEGEMFDHIVTVHGQKHRQQFRDSGNQSVFHVALFGHIAFMRHDGASFKVFLCSFCSAII